MTVSLSNQEIITLILIIYVAFILKSLVTKFLKGFCPPLPIQFYINQTPKNDKILILCIPPLPLSKKFFYGSNRMNCAVHAL